MIDYIVINDDLRTMQIPESITLLGVESDDDVNVINFKMPRMYKGFDLSTFEARVNYMNAGNFGDLYIADDLALDPEDETKMTFSWLVGRNACAYKGMTRFIVCLKLFADDDSGTVLKEFNTTVYSLPVLQGLETVDVVVQEFPDIIEYILRVMRESGVIDPNDYYTKAQIDAMIPTKLPNPQKLVINGNEYDGSEPVEVNIDANTTVLKEVSGALIHVDDAVPQAVVSLTLYDSTNNEVSEALVAVTNKNLFRCDLIEDQVIDSGITFDKVEDGSIHLSGTSIDTYPETSCDLDAGMFKVGRTYTLSSGKVTGYAYVQLLLTYTDETMETVIARNASTTFTITKAVASCVAAIMVAQSGVTVDGEVVYPQLEVGRFATAFVLNEYEEITYDGTNLPELPDAISNLWSNTSSVTSMTMEYEGDIIEGKIAEYIAQNMLGSNVNGVLVATYDGVGTVSLGIG